jgi:hypothetical protein
VYDTSPATATHPPRCNALLSRCEPRRGVCIGRLHPKTTPQITHSVGAKQLKTSEHKIEQQQGEVRHAVRSTHHALVVCVSDPAQRSPGSVHACRADVGCNTRQDAPREGHVTGAPGTRHGNVLGGGAWHLGSWHCRSKPKVTLSCSSALLMESTSAEQKSCRGPTTVSASTPNHTSTVRTMVVMHCTAQLDDSSSSCRAHRRR